MEAKLVIVSGASKAAEFPLRLPTVIGRSRNVDLPLGHSLVSRQHCELFEDAGVLKLRDLGSLNGTFMGQTRITADTVLEPGALFTVGPVTFRAVYGDMSPSEDASASSDFSEIVLPPRASGAVNGAVQMPAAPANDAEPKTANAEGGSDGAANDALAANDAVAANDDGATDANGLPAEENSETVDAVDAGAVSELATEELAGANGQEVFLLPPAESSGDANPFAWLEGGGAGGASSPAPAPDTTFDLGDMTIGAAPAGKESDEDSAAGSPEPASRSKAPRGKPAKKAPDRTVAKKGPAAKKTKPREPATEPAPDAAPAEPLPAEPLPMERASAKTDAAIDHDFVPPSAAPGGSGQDSDLGGVFDFLK